ncbi:hypothetical protein S245_036868, partial [Arachis hypogaea]
GSWILTFSLLTCALSSLKNGRLSCLLLLRSSKDQASDVGVLLADTDGIFHSIKSRSEQEREPDASTNKTSSEGSKYTVT